LPMPSLNSVVDLEPAAEMVWVPGATFMMGSNDHYPEEAPVHPVTVDGFWIDVTPVTNRQFLEFVNATGHVTFAERKPRAEDYPGAPPSNLRAGSLVFTPPKRPLQGTDISQWWIFTLGANWRHPLGRKSSIGAILDHPVVHVAYSDAKAYAEWAGKDLPTETEWELAARGGLDGAEFSWGGELAPGGNHMANTWQGSFPVENSMDDGFARTSPVRFYPPNGYGLYDMIGNVWEWTTDYWSVRHPEAAAKPCCIPSNPRNADADASIDPAASVKVPRRVLKGGSHLCAPNYCRRYRPAARHAQEIDTTTSHVGFRCVRRVR
jgi:formylglycine-generating enzyme